MFIALFMITSTTWAGRPLSCQDLASHVESLEVQLMRSQLPSCNSTSVADIVVPSGEETTVEATTARTEAYNTNKCHSLAAIESKLRTIEADITLLQGFEKLKNDIRTQREATAQAALPAARESALNFRDGVNTAQSFELLFATEMESPILSALRAIPLAQRSNTQQFMTVVRRLCTQRPSGSTTTLDACHRNFQPNDAALREINYLLEQPEPSDEQIASWRSSLEIKKRDDSEYSFNQMSTDLQTALPKISAGTVNLTRSELRAIQALPDFQSANSLRFLPDLAHAQRDMATHVTLEQFKFLTEDLKGRQEFELQSKVSLTWNEYKNLPNTLAPEDIDACNNSRAGFNSAKACVSALERLMADLPIAGQEKVKLEQMLIALRATQNFANNLQLAECFSAENLTKLKTDGTVASACNDKVNLDRNLVVLQNQALSLSHLRERILEENTRLNTFRNYVQEEMVRRSCFNPGSSIVGECSTDYDGLVSAQAVLLTSQAMQISVLHSVPAQTTDLAQKCGDLTDASPRYELAICDSLTLSGNDPLSPAVVNEPTDVAVNVENSRNLSREATINGIGNLLGTAARGLFPPQSPVMNPAVNPYAYAPTRGPGMGALSISDSILLPARVQGGYGFYRSTPGVTPYTSFPRYLGR